MKFVGLQVWQVGQCSKWKEQEIQFESWGEL